MSGATDPDRAGRVALLERWRALLLLYGDKESYMRLRADAEAAVARWVWAAEGSELHRIEPLVRELKTLPEPELLPQAPRPPLNAELYGYDRHERIVLVRRFDASGDPWEEEFLLHGPDEITSIGFLVSDLSRGAKIRRWRLRDGRVEESIEALGSGDRSVRVSRYLYAGARVEQVQGDEFLDPTDERTRTRSIMTPTYAPDGRVLELRVRVTNYEPFSQGESVLYRALPENLPNLPAQRETLTRRLSNAIAGALSASDPPGPLYGIVLSYGSLLGSDWIPGVSPLFEARRRYLKAAVAPTGTLRKSSFPPGSEFEYDVDVPLCELLWDPWTGPEPDEYVPEGVDPAPYEPRVIEDSMSDLYTDPELKRACEQYSQNAALADRDDGERAVKGLLLDVAARLSELDWNGRLEVTDDFVALAYEYGPVQDDVAATLKRSLTPERYAEFEARGWIPHDDEG